MLLLIPAPRWSVLLEYFFGYGDRGHRAGPAGVKRQVGNGLDQLVLRHAVLAREGQVGPKLVGSVHRDESADGNQAAIPRGQSRTRPHIPKQHVVSELGQLGGDVAEHSLGRRGLHGSGSEGTCNKLFHDFSPMLAQLKRELPQVAVLLVGDFLHPVDHLSVELFLDGDVGHGGGRRGAMPMLLAWRGRDNITRSNDLDRPAPALHIAAAGSDDQGLAQRVGVPCAAGAWLERDVGAARTCRSGRLEKLVDTYRAGEILGRPSGGGLRTVSFDVHLQSPLSDWCGANYKLASAAPVD